MKHRLIQTCVMATALAGFSASLNAQKPSVGSPAPSLDVKNAFNGGPVSWGDLEGKAVLVKFTATW